jgi:hypothetical protein
LPRLSRSKIAIGSGWRLVATKLVRVPSGVGWRGGVWWPRRGWRARVCCPAAVPRRGVLSLRVYRAGVLVSGPGSPRTGVRGRD